MLYPQKDQHLVENNGLYTVNIIFTFHIAQTWVSFYSNFVVIFKDGPRSSLKRLRNQLANDGCAESQVVLAKQLLEEQCGEFIRS